MIASCKKLLIPLCHGFILLPLAAIAAGSPGTGPLALLLAVLCGLGLVGWLADLLLPRQWPVWIGILLMMALGLGAGFAFLPQVFFGIVGQEPQGWTAPLLGLLSGAAMAWSQLECRRGLPAGLEPYKLGIGLALYILTYFSYRATGFYTAQDKSDLVQPIFLYGVMWLILSLLIINFQFVTRMAATKNQPDVPKPVRTFNLTLILGLLGIILFLSSLGFLRNLFSRFFLWLMERFTGSGGSAPAAPLPSFQPDIPTGEGFRFTVPEAPEWVRQLENVLIPMLTIALGLAALGLLCYKLRSLFRQFKGWIRQKMSRWQTAEGYVQEEESLMSWAQLKRELGERIRRRRPRPRPKLEDQPDDRAKVRWLFCRLREQLRRKRRFDSTQTPRELAEARFAQDPRVQRLLEDYNEARYSAHPVEPESVAAGLEALRRMR